MTLKQYFVKNKKLVEQELKKYLPKNTAYPQTIHKAMNYSVFNGGKRFRPILAIAVCEALGGKVKDVLPAACALELIHCYSLVHDDLPCMDDDDYRRGKLTCHKKFGEANAVLAGDALLTFAFEVLSQTEDAKILKRLLPSFTQAIGSSGMVGGQVVDKEFEHKEKLEMPEISYVNIQKTGQLIRLSCLTGALIAGATKAKEKAFDDYGKHLGFSFQVVDDIMDSDGFTRIMSHQEAFREAEQLTEQAKKSVQFLNSKSKRLSEIADFVLNRKK